MRQLAGVRFTVALLFALAPFVAHADLSQSARDTLTTDPAQANGGWSEELGSGISGALTKISLPIRFTRSVYGPSFSFDLNFSCNTPEPHGGSIGGAPFTTTPDWHLLAPDVETDVILTFDVAANNAIPFDPSCDYSLIVRNFAVNAGGLFRVYGSATDTYPYGSTDAGGLADLAFTLAGVNRGPTGPSNVLFIPGIESSRLYRPDGTGEKRLWEPADSLDATELVMNPDGSSANNQIYTRDVLDNAYVPDKGDVYKSLIADLDTLKSAGTINDWEAAPYDWRLSLDQILTSGAKTGQNISYLTATDTPFIAQELERLARTSKSGKVTIVAHSNGGLVAKALMQKLGDTETAQLIDKVILVASPQIGTPQALAGLLHGHDQALPVSVLPIALDPAIARSIGDTMPGIYALIPSAAYFTYVDTPVFTFSTTSLTSWVARYGETIHSQSTEHTFLTDPWRTAPAVSDLNNPTILSDSLLTRAETMHQTLDTWAPPAGVQVIQVAGWGVPTTVSGIDYVETLNQGNLTVYPNPRFTIDGDGTVVTPSALWLSSEANVQNYWLNMERYSDDHWLTTFGGTSGITPFSHRNITEVFPLREFITDVIKNTQQTLSTYDYLSTQAPAFSKTRLRYTLHSPLSLNLYDNQGHHTGISTTTGQIDEEIPGTYYTEFGDAKYIFTDTTTPVHLVMSGYANGTFTLNVDEYGGDTKTAGTAWVNMPTTPSTKVTLDTTSDISTLSPLSIDEDGDGTTDYTLAPKLNGVVTLDTTPPVTTAAVTGTQGTNSWYTSNVSITLTATDTESGIHATYYSLDGTATTTGSALAVTSEGLHTVKYYSDDNAGNIENVRTLSVKIDKTAPEVIISADIVAHDISVIGIDVLSSTTLSKGANTVTVTDAAGHTTLLTFQKTYSGKLLTYAKLTSIKYDIGPAVNLPSSFLYVWDSKQILISQTVAADSQFVVQALYDKTKNKTTIIVLKKNAPIQTQTVTGLAIIKLTTNKGNVVYGW